MSPKIDPGTDGYASPPEVSIVVPMYNEEAVLADFFERIEKTLTAHTRSYEIVCVDDGSKDNTHALLHAAAHRDHRIKLIRLSRNFGKEVALSAGLDYARGNAVIPIDADLQDPPEVIPEMLDLWRNGYDMVVGVREDRSSDTFLRRLTANLFYQVIGRLSDTPIPPGVGDFRLMDRKVVDALERCKERARFMKGLFGWLGFKQASVGYAREPRRAGTSKWHYWKLWNLALEGIVSFSTVPLRIWSYIGTFTSLGALIYMAYIIVRTLIFGVDVPGYASLLVALLFFSGLNMIGLGIIGEYIGRVYMESKQRPLYLTQEIVDLGGAEEHPTPHPVASGGVSQPSSQ